MCRGRGVCWCTTPAECEPGLGELLFPAGLGRGRGGRQELCNGASRGAATEGAAAAEQPATPTSVASARWAARPVGRSPITTGPASLLPASRPDSPALAPQSRSLTGASGDRIYGALLHNSCNSSDRQVVRRSFMRCRSAARTGCRSYARQRVDMASLRRYNSGGKGRNDEGPGGCSAGPFMLGVASRWSPRGRGFPIRSRVPRWCSRRFPPLPRE